MRLKRLSDQVVVVTGASSGIGRESALRLAAAGATVVGISRSDEQLTTLVDAITAAGGTARRIVCDVSDAEAVRHAAETVEQWFGRIDTWVNNASVILYAEFADTSADEFRRVMEVNYLGQIHGALAALPALRRAGGGALISVTSAEAFTSMPMHSAYAASKRAVEGAMDSLRRELIHERTPISVTTIRPGVIDTPIYAVGRSHMHAVPQAPPPFYDPAIVADCVVFSAEHPVRHLFAGGAARVYTAFQRSAPRVMDLALGTVGMRFMHTDEPAQPREGNLEGSLGDGRVRGALPRPGRRLSLYTWLIVRPGIRRALLASAFSGAALLTWMRRR